MRAYVRRAMFYASLMPIAWGVAAVVSGIVQDSGRVAYVDTGCARCHSVEAVDHDAAWVVSVVKQETELEGGAHRAPFRGTDEQLVAIAAWLVGSGKPRGSC